MNGLFLILSLIVIGYIYFSKDYFERYTISEISAHHLYYKSAIFGFYAFTIGLFFTFFILLYFDFWDYKKEEKLLQNIENLPDLKIIWIINFFISLIGCFSYIKLREFFLLRGIDKKKNINKLYAMTLTNPLDKLINDSAFLDSTDYKDKLIMLSMSDRKVYIGFVLSDKEIFNRFLYGQTEFIFCPIYSGYRHKDRQEVVITTDYDYQNLDKDVLSTKYNIILNKKNIVTGTKVDIDTLLSFTDKDDYLNVLKDISIKNLPVLISMKNKNLYIGYLLDDFFTYSSLNDINNIGLKLSYHLVYEKDSLYIKQYYDFNLVDDLYCNINFKEVESIFLRSNPEDLWKINGKVSAEMMKNIFNYKLIDLNKRQ